MRSPNSDNPTSFSFQGGNDGPCGIPFNVAVAVAMNITATGATGLGYLTAWALASNQPLASILNYTAGQNIANAAIVPVLPGTGVDFNVYAGQSTTHIVIDVLGYFAVPLATALDCTTGSSGGGPVANGSSFSFLSGPCPTGYNLTGGQFEVLPPLPVVSASILSANASAEFIWRCAGTNNSGTDVEIFCQPMCCRVPGR